MGLCLPHYISGEFGNFVALWLRCFNCIASSRRRKSSNRNPLASTACQAVFVFVMSQYVPAAYGPYKFPFWADVIGWFISISTLMPFPIFAVYRIIYGKEVYCCDACRPCTHGMSTQSSPYLVSSLFNLNRGFGFPQVGKDLYRASPMWCPREDGTKVVDEERSSSDFREGGVKLDCLNGNGHIISHFVYDNVAFARDSART